MVSKTNSASSTATRSWCRRACKAHAAQQCSTPGAPGGQLRPASLAAPTRPASPPSSAGTTRRPARKSSRAYSASFARKRVEEQASGVGDASPDDDEVQVADRADRGDHRRERGGPPAKCPLRQRIPARRRGGQLPSAGGGRRGPTVGPRPAHHRRSGRDGLDAAAATAHAGRTVVFDHHVPDVTGIAGAADVGNAVEHQSARPRRWTPPCPAGSPRRDPRHASAHPAPCTRRRRRAVRARPAPRPRPGRAAGSLASS